MIKKISVIIVAIVLMVVPSVFGADYYISQYNIDAEILENGDMAVTENIKYNFSEDMNGLYATILYNYSFSGQKDDMGTSSKRYQASNITDIKVYTSDYSFDNMKEAKHRSEGMLKNGMDGYYSSEFSSGEEKSLLLKVYLPVESGDDKYVRYEYVIKDVVVNYEDYSEIYWNFIGGDSECSMDNVTITLTFPDETKIEAYGHSFGNVDSFSNDGKKVTYKLSHLSSNTAADIRAVFPNTIMDKDAIKKQVDGIYDFDTLYEIEKTLAKNIENNKKYNAIFAILCVLTVIVGIVVISKNSKQRKGIITNYKKAEIFTDTLDEDSLITYSKILDANASSLMGNVINATILDLTYKKVLKMDARKEISGHKDKYKYMININKNAKFDTLTEYEKIVLNYIFLEKCSDEIFDLDEYTEFELNDKFKKLGTKTTLASKIRNKITSIDAKEKKKIYNNAPSKKYKLALISALILLILFIANVFAFSPVGITDGYMEKIIPIIYIMAIYVFVSLIATAIMGIELKDEYIERKNRLMGLKRYLKEYSLLKERYPIEIALWDKYMVFACLFGIADKVAKEFKEELITRGLSEDEINETYAYIYIGNHINTFNSSVMAATYAGSSSGSSSSGGFHGGGGGGRWWWWQRRLLKYKSFMI